MSDTGLFLCVDSGTTQVKAALCQGDGTILATAARENGSLRRSGGRVEQDMAGSVDDVCAVVAEIAPQAGGEGLRALVVTGQGDGLWPVDRDGVPVGPALTWLDPRASECLKGDDGAARGDALRKLTGTRPTSASQSLQMLWISRHDPARYGRIAHALRLKEWLYLALTGDVAVDVSAATAIWGNWAEDRLNPTTAQALGLPDALDRLRAARALADCIAPLSADAARRCGLSPGVPVLMGPGDVQASVLGLGLGCTGGPRRASVFGTSAIHVRQVSDAAQATALPPVSIVQKLELGTGYMAFMPCFNGTSVLRGLSTLLRDLPVRPVQCLSGLLFLPFLEPGGERAPVTSADARAALIGFDKENSPAQFAWAACESLAFIAATCHAMLASSDGPLAIGGGLSASRDFAKFLATVTGAEVWCRRDPGESLSGLALYAAARLDGTGGPLAEDLFDRVGPVPELRDYASRKRALFDAMLSDRRLPAWSDLADLRRLASA